MCQALKRSLYVNYYYFLQLTLRQMFGSDAYVDYTDLMVSWVYAFMLKLINLYMLNMRDFCTLCLSKAVKKEIKLK